MLKIPTFEIYKLYLTMKIYSTLTFTVASEDLADALKASLSEVGYDVFYDDSEQTFVTSILKEDFNGSMVDEIVAQFASLGSIEYVVNDSEEVNWNALWEQNYEPIIIGDKCIVRAEFHQPDKNYPYEIIITPKMAFGTGHHATTALMLALMLEMEINGKDLVDVGCGTGILAIMALKRGANFIGSCDTDTNAVRSACENYALNKANLLRPVLGTVAEFDSMFKIDIITANIQRSVIIEEMYLYENLIRKGGSLVVSGFYTADSPDIQTKAAEYGFELTAQKEKEGWCALQFIKKGILMQD